MTSAWRRHLGLALAVIAGTALADAPARARLVAPPPVSVAAPLALAAATPADADVRKVRLLGPSGQVYEPDGAGTWTRRVGGGVAADVTAAFELGGQLVVTGRGAPMYAFDGNVWRAAPIGQRGKVVSGAGPLPAIAIGPQVFVRDKQAWLRVGTAPGPVTALWASSKSNVRIATATTVLSLRGTAFVPLQPASAPPVVATRLVGAAPYAVTAAGLVDTSRPKLPVAVAMTDIIAATPRPPAGKDLWLVAAAPGAVPTLVPVTAGKLGAPIEIPVVAQTPIVAVTADRSGRVLLATAGGAVHLWDDHARAWSTGAVRDEVPGPGRGPGPARTR